MREAVSGIIVRGPEQKAKLLKGSKLSVGGVFQYCSGGDCDGNSASSQPVGLGWGLLGRGAEV